MGLGPWYAWLIVFIVGIPWAIFTHELSHMIVILIAGLKDKRWKINKLAFYPHKGEDGTRYLAAVYYYVPVAPEDATAQEKQNALESRKLVMPYINSSPLWMGFLLVNIFSYLSITLYLPLFAVALIHLTDCIWWWIGYLFPGQGALDGTKMRGITSGTDKEFM